MTNCFNSSSLFQLLPAFLSISVHPLECHKSEPNNDGSKNQGFFKGKFVELSSLNTDTTTYTCRLLHGLLDRFGSSSSSVLNILRGAVIPLNFPSAHRVRFFGVGKRIENNLGCTSWGRDRIASRSTKALQYEDTGNLFCFLATIGFSLLFLFLLLQCVTTLVIQDVAVF